MSCTTDALLHPYHPKNTKIRPHENIPLYGSGIFLCFSWYKAIPRLFNSRKFNQRIFCIVMGGVWAILIEKRNFDPQKSNIDQNTKISCYTVFILEETMYS